MMATKKRGVLGRKEIKKKITNTHAIPNMIHVNSFFPVKLVGHTKKKLFKRLQRLNCPAAGRESAPELCVISCMIRYKLCIR